ncbi:hypothetical protein TNIN_169301 [Trichonephila inaurata madagascariensis]|uniref:Uncharacterized protein n=1 Tax=Trichonephila inaurata madagascariensis TaxID=2747483 RepID=A0A8X6MET6_9ARAC|nr:hypothetical protein TNIN_169301 [Trichonephila inaurata madagascariensis]
MFKFNYRLAQTESHNLGTEESSNEIALLRPPSASTLVIVYPSLFPCLIKITRRRSRLRRGVCKGMEQVSILTSVSKVEEARL